ncbi:MAG: restriction endonuclease subunit S [Ruegeria sp.]
MTAAAQVPALRFPEFGGELQSTRLGDLMTITSASRVLKEEWTEEGVPFFRSSDVVSIYKGTRNEKAFISKALFDKLSKKSGRLYKDDLLVTGGGSIGVPYLVSSNDPLYSKDADLIWLKNGEQTNGPFIYAFLTSQVFRKYLKSISHIGTISHYTIEQAKATPIRLPSLPEQKKIAAFFEVIDAKITVLQERQAGLERYKRGLMQALISQTLRFTKDDGTAFPDWEEKRLGDVFEVTRGQVLAMPETSPIPTIEKPFPVFSSQTKNNGLAGYHNEYLYEDAITWTTDGANAGDTRFRSGKFFCTNVCGVLLNSEGYANTFVAEMINQISERYVSYVGNPKLMNGVMASIKLNFPHPEEQAKIAEVLLAMDAKITTVAQQVAQMQAYKKGLLQQMFV